MAIFKCKMCGGNVNFTDGATVGVCDSCGTKQTLPRLDDDRRANLYDRANHFRRNNEFDKAAGIYEQILNEDPTDAEAYWSLVLCQYGIEYVEDPATHKRVPTVNRAQFTSIFDDDNYKSALQYADADQRGIYEAEANAINEIQKGILAISQKEEPFDVFICYKETDNNGRRTPDSVLANDLYHQLTQEGFKVFFARITLEDKLGTAYEPYIFAALNSAKVMVVLGTKPEYFNAVWVKNEWSRYLALVKKSGGKKVLIPAYKDMDPYDLPEEFSHLQAQDMSKLGFMQDLIRGIKKLVNATGAAPEPAPQVVPAGNVTALLERASLFLEDGEWQKADDFCEQVLNQDPKNAQAYLYKLMAELRVRKQDDLANFEEPFDPSNNYQKAVRFGGEKMASLLNGYIAAINDRRETVRLTRIYNGAVKEMNAAKTEMVFKKAAETFRTIPGFQDADTLALQCLEKAETCRKDSERKAEERRIAQAKVLQKRKKVAGILIPIVICIIVLIVLAIKVIIPDTKYKSAVDLYNAGKYDEAIVAFQALNGYKDSVEQISKCETIIQDKKYNSALDLYNASNYDDAIIAFTELNDYKDSAERVFECFFQKQKPELKNLTVGSTIKFGIYEQDGNKSNGKEEIEWIVVEADGNKALIISKRALDNQMYNSTAHTIAWETCTLRTWLNRTFYNEAFGRNHQQVIQSTNVTADNNPSYDVFPGYDTTDKVFLLSISEVNKYFSSDEARKCSPTDFAIIQGSWISSSYSADGKAACLWWLRSPGYNSKCAAFVNDAGTVYNLGHNVNDDYVAVRPAMWISLEP